MHRGLRRTLMAVTAAVLLAPGCARDPRPGTPEAAAEGERLMRQMSDTLGGARAFSFATAETLDRIGGRPGDVLRFTRAVTVRRPGALFFELHGTGDTTANVSVFYDGKTVSLRNNADGHWAQAPVPATLDEMLDDVARRFGLPVPIADVVYSVPHEAFIGRNSKGGFVGRQNLNGVSCAHLAYSDEFVDVHVWVPTSGKPLPRRLELVYKRAPGAPMARVDFTSWDLAPQIAGDTFAFQPGEAAAQVPFEQFVGGLLSGGSPVAPAAADRPAPGTAIPRE